MTEFGAPHWTTYDVSGATLADVAAVLTQRDEAGETTWNPTHTMSWDDSGNVTDVTVHCGFDVQMPNWVEYSQASADAQTEWDRWYGALEEHEQGHLTIAEGVFTDLESQMVGKSQADAEAAFQAAVTKAQTDSDAYDTGNGHGTTASNSTVMDTNIP
ncbi:MAG: DUF922 domain-containing Zn-dependent protease [Actinomycetota bacterium]|nr:DUF922 domain-containing protein [Acidimicrobiia bacterium]MDQ3294533.1 DUF922 domain-containing Zn-dependent protease [Actinomycetota bacterium]